MRLIVAALASLLLLPAAASASTISTTPSEGDYVAAANDTLSMQVYSGNSEPNLGNQPATYFLPTGQPPLNPGTSDATNCRVVTTGTGASYCVRRNLTRVTLQGQDDFVLVGSLSDTLRVDAGA